MKISKHKYQSTCGAKNLRRLHNQARQSCCFQRISRFASLPRFGWESGLTKGNTLLLVFSLCSTSWPTPPRSPGAAGGGGASEEKSGLYGRQSVQRGARLIARYQEMGSRTDPKIQDLAPREQIHPKMTSVKASHQVIWRPLSFFSFEQDSELTWMPVIIIVTILLAWAVVISLPASPSPACRESLECWRSRDYISVLF